MVVKAGDGKAAMLFASKAVAAGSSAATMARRDFIRRMTACGATRCRAESRPVMNHLPPDALVSARLRAD